MQQVIDIEGAREESEEVIIRVQYTIIYYVNDVNVVNIVTYYYSEISVASDWFVTMLLIVTSSEVE